MKKHWGDVAPVPPQIESSKETRQKNGPEYREPAFLEVVDNHIYFYAEIYRDKTLKLNQQIRCMNTDLLVRQQTWSFEGPKIFLHINSFGGEVFAGLSVLDEIASSKIPIHTIVDGCCASAATLFSIAGAHRIIRPHGFMLIHQISSMMWGKYSEFQDEMKNLSKFMDVIKSVYKKYTKVPMKKVDEILSHDIWFDAKESVEYGLVDEIA